MADEPSDIDEQAPEADEHGGEADGTPKRMLCRSSTDKVIAGVAGGLGAYFGIDSVIVRIAFIVLTFMGGAGPFLYLIGWLLLPREDSRSVIAKALGGDSPRRVRSLLAVVFIGLGLMITAGLSRNLFELFGNVWRIAPFLSLILIAAGVALVLWPGSAGRPKQTPARPPTSPVPVPGTPTSSSAYATPAPPPPTAAGPEWPTVSPPPPAPRRRRGRTTTGYLTVAALLVYTGAAVMLDRLGAVEVDIGVYFAVALAITGIGLLVSAFAVPARGLILLGVVLAAPLLLFAGSDVSWGSGVGEVRVSVADIDELREEYHHGLGLMVVDLRDLDPDRTNHSVDLSLGIGELRVYVPSSLQTTADIDVRAGDIRVRYSDAPPARVQDLRNTRGLLEGLWTLQFHPEEDLNDLQDYLNAHERLRGIWVDPERRLSLARLVGDPDLEGADLRNTMEWLIDEARRADRWRDESEAGLGIERRVVVPSRVSPQLGGPAGDLRMKIDVGIGEAEVVVVSASPQGSTGS